MNKDFRKSQEPYGYWFGIRELPSPSAVFVDLGLTDPRFFTPGSRARGRAVHAGLHYALKGTLDWTTLDPDLHGFVKSGLRLIERKKPTIIRMEVPLYHPTLFFAGTSDIEWELDGWRWIPDFKSGKASDIVKYQTAAYEMLARANLVLTTPGITAKPFKRAAIELQRDGSIANLVRYEDHTDGAGWLNLLGAYRIRQEKRLAQLSMYYPQGEPNHVA